MNKFRKQTDSARQQARTVDGFIARSGRVGLPSAQEKRPAAISSSSFRRRSGRVDDFKRPEGFYANRQSSARSEPARSDSERKRHHYHKDLGTEQKNTSILHMTLPGGSLAKKQRSSKKKPLTRWQRVRRWSLRSAAVAACLVVLVGGFLVFKGYLSLSNIFKGGGNAAALGENVTPDLLNGEGDGRVNVLLLGKGGPGHDGADLTDTILIASVDPVNKSASLVSIPRDLWVSNGNGSSKINAVYANAKSRELRTGSGDQAAQNAGVEAIKKTVSEALAIPIHYYAMVDFEAFQKAVDTVGGVTIDVPEDLIDHSVAWENGGSPVLARKGVQTFDGRQALFYVRSRHGSTRGDFDRAERQRLFISALAHEVLSAGTYANPVKITQLLDNFGDHVSTDFSVGHMLRMMEIAKDIPTDSINSIGLADPPNVLVKTGNLSGQSIVMPIAGIGDYSEIQAYIRQQLQDGYILKEQAKIMVLNGSGKAKLATSKADQLKSYGYNVVSVGDAPTQQYQQTVIVCLNSDNPFTKNYLQKRFGVESVEALPDDSIVPNDADFVIILGSNETADS